MPNSEAGVLRAVLRVAAAAAVAQADVQVAVGAELHLPAVVVGVGLVDEQHLLRAGRVSQVRIACADAVAGDDGVAAVVGVVDVEIAVGGVVRMEGQAQQSLLIAAAAHQRVDVQKRRGQQRVDAVGDGDYPNVAGFLDHEEPRAVARRRGQVHRPGQTRRDELQLHGVLRGFRLAGWSGLGRAADRAGEDQS